MKAESAMESINLVATLAGIILSGSRGAGDVSSRIQSFLKSGGAKVIAQQMPHWGGLGFAENSLAAHLLEKVDSVQPGTTARLEKLFVEFTDYESYFFWMVFAGIQVQKEKVGKAKEEKKGDGSTEEDVLAPVSEASQDDRVKAILWLDKLYQRKIEEAKTTEEKGEKINPERETIKALYEFHIFEVPLLLRIWLKLSSGFQKSVLEPLKVKNAKELSKLSENSFAKRLKDKNDRLEAELVARGICVKADEPDKIGIVAWLLLKFSRAGSYDMPKFSQTSQFRWISEVFYDTQKARARAQSTRVEPKITRSRNV